MLRSAFFVFLIFFNSSAHARVFNFSDSWVSAYFRGTGGQSLVGNDAFVHTSGNQTYFEDKVRYNFSGEIGFAFQVADAFIVRAGVEGLQTRSITANGTDAAGTTPYMDIETKVVAFNPNVAIEYGFNNTATSRFLLFGGAGYATVKVSNDYAVTGAGVGVYSSPANFKETWVAEVINYTAGAGYEIFILDNVTFTLTAGWRYFDIPGFEYHSDTTVIRGGGSSAVTAGSIVTNDAGEKVALDLGGSFVGVTFKFHIPPLN